MEPHARTILSEHTIDQLVRLVARFSFDTMAFRASTLERHSSINHRSLIRWRHRGRHTRIARAMRFIKRTTGLWSVPPSALVPSTSRVMTSWS